MIVVVGSGHDPVAVALVDGWPGAALLSAQDLTSPGWRWTDTAGVERWVIGGRPVDDQNVTGVFVRRSTVLPDELLHVHPEDRAYAAAEAHAFAIAVLGSTSAVVANPVGEGALGAQAIRPERWIAAAGALGLEARPVRLTSRSARPPQLRLRRVEVVGTRVLGEASARCRAAAAALVGELGITWAACAFDGRGRLVALSTAAAPSPAAADALGRLLGGAR